MSRHTEVVEIEDRTDCRTCELRARDEWQLMLSARVKSLGTCWCQECGREFTVIVEDDSLPS